MDSKVTVYFLVLVQCLADVVIVTCFSVMGNRGERVVDLLKIVAVDRRVRCLDAAWTCRWSGVCPHWTWRETRTGHALKVN